MRKGVPSADLILLTCVVLWGLNFSITKYGLTHGFQPLAYTAPRFAIATAVYLCLTRVREGSLLLVSRRDLLGILGLGGVIAGNQLAFIYGLNLSTASTTSLLFATMPIFAALFTPGRHGLRHWLATAVSGGGVALVALGASGGLSSNLGAVGLVLFAMATWAGYSIVFQPYMRRYSPVRVNAIASLGACVPLFAAASHQLSTERWGEIGWLGWGSLLYSSLVAYAFANLLWFIVVDRVGTARASIYVNLQPFLGALFAVLILSDSIGGLQIAGGLVIAVGIVIARWRKPLVPPAE